MLKRVGLVDVLMAVFFELVLEGLGFVTTAFLVVDVIFFFVVILAVEVDVES